jgi:predicted metal-binding protein
MKVGLIRCLQTEDMCPGTTCFNVMRTKRLAFSDITEDIEIIGVTTCGGCPGKKAVTRAKEMVKRGADTIVLASCITKGNPIDFPCPFAKKIESSIRKELGESIRIINYTH